MPITLNGDSGITTPTYGGTDTSEYLVPVTAFKNRIINGQMMIDQRNAGASHTITTGGLFYGVDRFFTFCSGANLTGQRISGTNTGTAYAYKITGATGSTSANYGQRIENLNVLDLNSQTVTVSLKLYASAIISNVSVTLFYCSGVNTGYGSTSSSQPITVGSGLNTYSVNFTLPSTASNGFECAIGFASGIGNGVSVEISQIQLEKGSTATSFDYRPYGTELALAQRYYYRISNNSANSLASFATGVVAAATQIDRAYSALPVTMRSAPTIGINSLRNYDGVTASAVTSVGSNFSTTTVGSASFVNSGGGLGVGRQGMVIENTSSAYLEFSAEL